MTMQVDSAGSSDTWIAKLLDETLVEGNRTPFLLSKEGFLNGDEPCWARRIAVRMNVVPEKIGERDAIGWGRSVPRVGKMQKAFPFRFLKSSEMWQGCPGLCPFPELGRIKCHKLIRIIFRTDLARLQSNQYQLIIVKTKVSDLLT